MYVKLKPELMAGRAVTASDITSALRSENLESPGGEVRNDSTVMSVRTARTYNTPEDFQYLVINASDNTPIYLKRCGGCLYWCRKRELDLQSDGVVNISLGVIPQSDANPLEVAKLVRSEVDNIQKFLPEGTRPRLITTRQYLSSVQSKRCTARCLLQAAW